jgi:hypothetical protein
VLGEVDYTQNTDGSPVKYVPTWFPRTGFQNYAKQARADNRQMRDMPIEAVMAEMVRHLGNLACYHFLTTSCRLTVPLRHQ